MLCDISDTHVLSLENFFRMNGLDYARGTLSVTAIFTEERKAITTKDLESVSSPKPDALIEAECKALLDRKNHLQALQNLQKAGYMPWLEAPLLIRYVASHDGYLTVQTKA